MAKKLLLQWNLELVVSHCRQKVQPTNMQTQITRKVYSMYLYVIMYGSEQ